MSLSNLFTLQALIEIRFYITQYVPRVKGNEKKEKGPSPQAHILKIRRLNYINLNGSDNLGSI